ncbi:MAG TPA: hypothetical protein DFS52_04280 [Myxococcales bacterium]|jgi:serine/threonine-protein kinase|nr:hypothetical protein [Myxococcales bacterium]
MATVLHQKFELLQPVGAGGVGTVWRANDRTSGKVVALKVLHPHLRSDHIVCLRFRREVEIAQSLRHGNLVTAYELFEDEGALSFSMELLEGRTLKEEVLAKGPLPVERAVAICRQCLEGLAAAHAGGVIHRDFKPQNVFLCDSGAVKLLDFGFARVANAAGLTTKSLVLCTPDYAAPEVIGGNAVDGRADLYGLGVTLFEALTGQLPFRGATPFDLLRRHLESAPPSPRQLRPEIPPGLEAVVLRLLEKAPQARFPTCEAALAALDQPAPAAALSARHAPVSACPACGEPRETAWPLCPACGASERGHAAGEWMVVLTRVSGLEAPGALLEVVRSLGAEPKRALAKRRQKAVKGLPKLILKQVSEPLARLVRDRCLARDLQVELRKIGENNTDLLHRSNTPGYLFAAALLLPWGGVVAALLVGVIGGGAVLPFVVALVLGPLAGLLLVKQAHLLLPALARLPKVVEARPFPASLASRYRASLAKLRSPAVRGTLKRIFERALVIHSAAHEGAPHVRMLLEEPCRSALTLAERSLDLARQVDDALARLALAGEAELFDELESLKARALADPAQAAVLQPSIAAKEQALEQAGQLERVHVQSSQRLLQVASTLELAAAQALVVGLPDTVTGMTVELKRLVEQAHTAVEVAQDVSRELAGEPAIGVRSR